MNFAGAIKKDPRQVRHTASAEMGGSEAGELGDVVCFGHRGVSTICSEASAAAMGPVGKVGPPTMRFAKMVPFGCRLCNTRVFKDEQAAYSILISAFWFIYP